MLKALVNNRNLRQPTYMGMASPRTSSFPALDHCLQPQHL